MTQLIKKLFIQGYFCYSDTLLGLIFVNVFLPETEAINKNVKVLRNNIVKNQQCFRNVLNVFIIRKAYLQIQNWSDF